MVFSFAGRDDADDFFAIAVLPLCMHERHSNDFSFDASRADRVPTLLAGFIDPVPDDEAVQVFEHECGQFE